MNDTRPAEAQLASLGTHLTTRRKAILKAWRESVESDPELANASTLARSRFNDHIPQVLDAFADGLSPGRRGARAAMPEKLKEDAGRHGLHRWQQGYDQRQVMREWGHLHVCLVDELENYGLAHPAAEPSVMPTARRALARLCSEGVCESASQYAYLQQTEAAGRLRDLEGALMQLHELEHQRAEFWREAAHDLRGSLGVVNGATVVLNQGDVPEPQRARFLTMLQQGVSSLQALLDDLMDLARLDAGQERRNLERFDAAAVITELCAGLQPVADEYGLFLQAEGPTTLPVEGDSIKTRRIVQNLLLNALRYTDRGGVTVSWAERRMYGTDQWILCVQDTGPGFEGGSVTPLAHALKQATEEAQETEEEAAATGESPARADPPPTLASRSVRQATPRPPGEGIGLSIIKRLCELLDASLELETAVGDGTTFRVIFPRQYGTPPG